MLTWDDAHPQATPALTPRPGCRIDRLLLDQAEVLVESSVDEDGCPLLRGVLINGRLIDPESCIHADVLEEWRNELRLQLPRVFVDTVREIAAKERFYADRYGD